METGEPLLLRLVPSAGARSGPTVEPEGTVVVERNPCMSGGSLEIFLEPHLPAPRIQVVGAAPIARALEALAGAAGYDVVCGPADEARPLPDDAAVIVASHGAGEERVLGDALTAGVPYVALVASRVRGAAVREALDVAEELRAKLHAPAGLEIGARTPEEIAIAILAELVAEHHAHPAAPPTPHEAVDPICGMTVAVSEATPRLSGAAGTLFFCGEGCRDAYAQRQLRDVGAR